MSLKDGMEAVIKTRCSNASAFQGRKSRTKQAETVSASYRWELKQVPP